MSNVVDFPLGRMIETDSPQEARDLSPYVELNVDTEDGGPTISFMEDLLSNPMTPEEAMDLGMFLIQAGTTLRLLSGK